MEIYLACVKILQKIGGEERATCSDSQRMVTVQITEHHRLLASTKLYRLVTVEHRCEDLPRIVLQSGMDER